MKLKDKVLHSVFLLSLVIMIACAIITIQCLISDSAQSGVKKFRVCTILAAHFSGLKVA